jgi:REP element-mobilizing transposase RayT
MKNHFHLLIEVSETPLSKIMQSLLFRYTRYFNKRYGKVGHLFHLIKKGKKKYFITIA